jgi:peptide/nickel transport system permease protein
MASQSIFVLVLRRLLQAIPALTGIVIVTFILTRALPGDPAALFAGPTADEKSIEEVRKTLGLSEPLHTQFILYVKALAHGDLGRSITTGQNVGQELIRRIPASLELTLLALLISVSVAVPLGVMAATRPNSWLDHLCRVTVSTGVSLPPFFTGLAFIALFYVFLGLTPAPIGRLNVLHSPPFHITGLYVVDALLSGDLKLARAAFLQLLLPACTLALFTAAPIARMARGSMLQILSSDFVRTARASGLRRRTVLLTYAFRNATLPVITTFGMVFSFTLGANVLVEKVFSWPGLGAFAVDALVSSDYAAVQGFVLAMAVIFVLLNLTIDVIYLLIDPRVRIDA